MPDPSDPAPADETTRWPDYGGLGCIRCKRCGDVLTAPRKYDLCPDCCDAMLAAVRHINAGSTHAPH
jgi:uncharacterized OB-fold protein